MLTGWPPRPTVRTKKRLPAKLLLVRGPSAIIAPEVPVAC